MSNYEEMTPMQKLEVSKNSIETILYNLSLERELHHSQCPCSDCDRMRDYYREQREINERDLEEINKKIASMKKYVCHISLYNSSEDYRWIDSIYVIDATSEDDAYDELQKIIDNEIEHHKQYNNRLYLEIGMSVKSIDEVASNGFLMSIKDDARDDTFSCPSSEN